VDTCPGAVHIPAMEWNGFTTAYAALFAAHNGLETVLDVLQLRHLGRRGDRVPAHLAGRVDPESIGKAAAYGIDKLRLGLASRGQGAALVALCVGWGFAFADRAAASLGFGPLLTGLVFLGGLGLASTLAGLPLDAVSVFVVGARHGMNRTTPRTFVLDRLKGLLVSAAIGGALVAAALGLMGWRSSCWWLAAFGAVASVQVLVLWLYPVVVMPLFNRFSPVADDLRADVESLARGAGFPVRSVVTMDGSRRTAHVNAFVVGLGRARRIVLFDTLVRKLGRGPLLAVVAHELGHFRLGHVGRRVALVLALLLAFFAGLAALRGSSGLDAGLGFTRPSDHATLLAFALFVTEAAFPAAFVLRALSRRDELDADRFAVETMRGGDDLDEALVALHRENLSSPGSHRLYRAYHNTHPALRERLAAIRDHARDLERAQVAAPVPAEGVDHVGGGEREARGDAGLAPALPGGAAELPRGEGGEGQGELGR
jgi:STE24 endopeptidase